MADKISLTQLAVDRLQPGPVDYVTWDKNLPGFGVRTSTQGTKTYFVQYRYIDAATGKRRERMQTLGRSSFLSPQQARERAKAAKAAAAAGVDPLAERKAAQAKAEAEQKVKEFTLSALVDRYLSEYVARNNRGGGPKAKAYLLGRWTKVYGDRPANSITEQDVRAFKAGLSSKGRNGGVNQANHLIAVLRHCYDWALDEKLVTQNPAKEVKKTKMRRVERERFLSDEEIKLFWSACDQIGWPAGPIMRLLLLLGQREMEIGGLRVKEINFETKTINLPGSRTKNGKPHTVPLSPMALAILQAQPRIHGSEFVFTTNGKVPFQNYLYARKRLSQIMGVDDWRVHDLRRSAATLLASLDVRLEVIERILNHVGGSLSVLARTYNRHSYADACRDALDKLSAKIAEIVGVDPGKEQILQSQELLRAAE